MSVNFMDLKPNYKTFDEYVKFNMVVFPIMQANLIMKLKKWTQYPLKSLYKFEDLMWI